MAGARGIIVLIVIHVLLHLVRCDVASDVVRCYDCNYDPTQYVNDGDDNSDRGFQRCALKNDDDGKFVDGWPCTSGTCFLRKDPNGLVYRGCADRWNLPWGIDTSVSCSYQGHSAASLWWFCEGNFCNSGDFGDDGICPERDGHVVDAVDDPEAQPVGGSYMDDNSHGYDDIMVHADTFDAGTYMDEAPERFYDFHPLPSAQETDDHRLGHGHDENNAEGPIYDQPMFQPMFQEFPPNRDESMNYYDHADPFYGEDSPVPVPMVPSVDTGPPALINTEFQHHYQSLIPRPDTEHNAGFGPPGSGGSDKKSDHESLKSWEPKKSVDTPESYHKSWQGNDFSVSFGGNGMKSDVVKSSSNKKKSGFGYTDHSKSMSQVKSEQSYKSPGTSEKGYISRKSAETDQNLKSLKSEHSKSSYDPPAKSDYNPEKQYIPEPPKSAYMPPKSEYLSAPMSQKNPSKSNFPQQKSKYTPPKSIKTPQKSAHPKKSSFRPPMPKVSPSKSDYVAPKPALMPPKSVSPPKSHFMQPKPQHIQSDTKTFPHKSDYNTPKSTVISAKSVYNQQALDLPPQQSKYTPLNSQVEAPTSMFANAPKSEYNPPKSQYEINVPKSPAASADYNSPKSKYSPSKPSPPKSEHDAPHPAYSPRDIDQSPSGLDRVPVHFYNPPMGPLPPLPPLPYSAPLVPNLLLPPPPPVEIHDVQDAESLPESPRAYDRGDEDMDVQEANVGYPGDMDAPDMRSAGFGDYWYQHYFRGDRTDGERAPVDDDTPPVVDNPCNFDCNRNPSGLFPHPSRVDWFIQCGAGMDDYGASCGCCKPNYLRCPDGTTFDLFSGVCGTLTDPSHYAYDTKQG